LIVFVELLEDPQEIISQLLEMLKSPKASVRLAAAEAFQELAPHGEYLIP
jgi:hypothetical protein